MVSIAAIDGVLREADHVVITLPLTAETRGLFSTARLAAMKRGAHLYNVGRGGIVDQAALLAALRSGHLAGAGLDVTDPEPLPGDHPLLDAPNLLVVPHIASATHATRGRMADIAVDNLMAGLAGEPMPHSVNAEALAARATPQAP
jgi:glyoxylate reductase